MVRLLVVDWDFFFPVKEEVDDTGEWQFYDWNHSERDPIYHEFVWYTRAHTFWTHGRELPRTSGEEKTFWDRFVYHPRAKLYFGESNSMAYHDLVRKDVDEVWLFDAHHDAGYNGQTMYDLRESGVVTCDNWMMALRLDGVHHNKIFMRYPRWKTYAFDYEPEPGMKLQRSFDTGASFEPKGPVDRIFVCRSGSWVPPWLDRNFNAFIKDAPVRKWVNLGLIERSWNERETRETWDNLRAYQILLQEESANGLSSAPVR